MRVLRFSPGSLLGSRKKPFRASREFATLIGEAVNATVSHAPIAFVEIEGSEFEGYIAHAPGAFRAPESLPLVDGGFLYLYQRLVLRRKEKFLTTAEYRYTYETSQTRDDWIFRYEYLREPGDDYPYPLAHAHFNGTPEKYAGGKSFPALHLPTGRVTVEDVLRHLVVEHEIGPISDSWEQTLKETKESFEEIQRKRIRGASTEKG